MSTNRRTVLQLMGGLAIAGYTIRPAFAELPKLEKKDKYKVGFAQTESNNPWRLAQTASMKAEAEKRGWQLVYTDAAGSAAKQVADVRSMIAQNVDVILLAPREEKPLIPAVMEAKKAGIPLLLIDRNVDQSLAKGGEDYVAFIGSDFVKEGMQAAEVLTKAVGGNAKIIELQGTVGSSPANDRMKGFADYIKDHPGMQIIASQSGDFARDKGRQVFETLYQAHPEATALYSHNDEMTMGAIAAMEAAGKVPGKDLIIASIDGTKDATQALIDGKILVVVECNPKFGPAAFARHREVWQRRDARAPPRQHRPRLHQGKRRRIHAGSLLRPTDRTKPSVGANGLPRPIAAGQADQMTSPLLSMTAITKSFGGVPALSEASLEVMPAEIMALVGQNGAGKSTMIKIINGAYVRDSGIISFNGSPLDCGIAATGATGRHQHHLPGNQPDRLPLRGREHLLGP